MYEFVDNCKKLPIHLLVSAVIIPTSLYWEMLLPPLVNKEDNKVASMQGNVEAKRNEQADWQSLAILIEGMEIKTPELTNLVDFIKPSERDLLR